MDESTKSAPQQHAAFASNRSIDDASHQTSKAHQALRGQPLAVQLRSLRPGRSYDEQVADRSPNAVAAAGFTGGGSPLPHLDRIQAAFGRHDVSSVRYHDGPAAQSAAQSLGASAYAQGDQVGSSGSMDLHTAAHEAAHTVQQRGGVQLKGGIGQSGDAYETHADKVADAVVRGESAEGLLDASPTGGGSAPGVQLSESDTDGAPPAAGQPKVDPALQPYVDEIQARVPGSTIEVTKTEEGPQDRYEIRLRTPDPLGTKDKEAMTRIQYVVRKDGIVGKGEDGKLKSSRWFKIAKIDVEKPVRGRRVSSMLYRMALAHAKAQKADDYDGPKYKNIDHMTGDLAESNRDVYWDGRNATGKRKGKPKLNHAEALKLTPAYKNRARLGYDKIAPECLANEPTSVDDVIELKTLKSQDVGLEPQMPEAPLSDVDWEAHDKDEKAPEGDSEVESKKKTAEVDDSPETDAQPKKPVDADVDVAKKQPISADARVKPRPTEDGADAAKKPQTADEEAEPAKTKQVSVEAETHKPKKPAAVPDDHVPVANAPQKPDRVPDDHVPVANAPQKPAAVPDDHVPVANADQPQKPARVSDDHVPVSNDGPQKPAAVPDDHVPVANDGPDKPALVPDSHVPVANADDSKPAQAPPKPQKPKVNVKSKSPDAPKSEAPPEPPKQKVKAKPKADEAKPDQQDDSSKAKPEASKSSKAPTTTKSGHLVDNDGAKGGKDGKKKPSNHSTEIDFSNISKGKVDIAHNFNLASINTTVPIIGAAGAGNGAGLFLQLGANAALKANASIEIPPDKDTWSTEVDAGIGGGGNVSLKAGIQVDAGPVTAEATVAANAALNINTGVKLKVEGNKESWRVVGMASGLNASISASAGATATLQAGVGTISAGHTWNLAGPYVLPILQANYPVVGKGTFAVSPEVKQLGAKIGAGISNAASAIKNAAKEKVDGFVDGVTGLDDKEAERQSMEGAANSGNDIGVSNWRTIKKKSGFYKYTKFVNDDELAKINDLGDQYIKGFELHRVNAEKGVDCDNWAKCQGYRESAFEVMKGVKARVEKARLAALAKREQATALGQAKSRLRGNTHVMASTLSKMYYQARTAKERGASQGAIHNTQFDACNNAYHGLYSTANSTLNSATEASQCDSVNGQVATLTLNMRTAMQKLRTL